MSFNSYTTYIDETSLTVLIFLSGQTVTNISSIVSCYHFLYNRLNINFHCAILTANVQLVNLFLYLETFSFSCHANC